MSGTSQLGSRVLDLLSASAPTVFTVGNTSNSGNMLLYDANTPANGYLIQSSNSLFSIIGNTGVTNTFVGIGTTAPTSTLHVQGLFSIKDTTAGGIRLYDRTTNTNYWDTFSTSNNLYNQYNGATKSILTTTGDLNVFGTFNGFTVNDRVTATNKWTMFADDGTTNTKFKIYSSLSASVKLNLDNAGNLETAGYLSGNPTGSAVPSASSISSGTKILLYSYTAGSPYSIGIEPNYMFFNTANGGGYKWYNGASQKMILTSAGGLTTSGFSISGGLTLGGNLGRYLIGNGATTATADNYVMYGDGVGLTVINTTTTGIIYFNFNDSTYYFMNTGSFSPFTDNTSSCGQSVGRRWTAVYAVNGTIQTSDAREKTDITPSALGLDFINKLKPVSYRWKVGQNNIEDEKVVPREGRRIHYGLIAQEVKETIDSLGVGDFGGWVLGDLNDPESSQGLNYFQFISPLVKAVQELTKKNASLEERLILLENKINV